MLVGAVDAGSGVSFGWVGLRFWHEWAYACARKTMPTRLRRLTRKAMLGDVGLLGFLVLGQLR